MYAYIIYIHEYVSAAYIADIRCLTVGHSPHVQRSIRAADLSRARANQTDPFFRKLEIITCWRARAFARSRHRRSANRKTNVAMSDCDFCARGRVSHSGIARISRHDIASRQRHSRWTECAARPTRHYLAGQRSIEHSSYHANGRHRQ